MKAKIQIIGYNKRTLEGKSGDKVTSNSFESPLSFDEFDFNIIDMSDKGIWRNNRASLESINSYKDLKHLKEMIENSEKSKIIIIYPQECSFNYDYITYNQNYNNSIDLKNNLENLMNMFNKYFGIGVFPLSYENNITYINKKKFESSFYFNENNETETFSNSGNSTTIKNNEGVYLTTLKINSYEDIISFLKKIKLIVDKSEEPVWFNEIKRFDDNNHEKIIKENNEEIDRLRQAIKKSNEKLMKNNRLKSILYTADEELVEVVYEMLEHMLNYDLSEFKDEYKEDFLIQLDNITFIGEIKGKNSNVKSEHLSQLDRHYTKYKDKLKTENKEENIYKLLIINPLRNKPLEKRAKVEDEQVKEAKNKYECLIILTDDFLRLYEEFVKGIVDVSEVTRKFTEKNGLFEI